METVLERPTKREQKMASESVTNFTSAISMRKSDTVNIRIQESEELFTIPRRALEFLSHILSIMAEGKAISVFPSESELSTQQAADILHVSRPHIVKLLEQGVIPFKKAGSHRRILLEDLMKHAAMQKETTRKNLKFLVEQAQDLNLGYE
ncbi:helix-turn-helix domain-containing protein [Dyadobacter sp. LJ53]|uniref:helix-turn-helix domain-containing protein n=1 Tax=Dyadobacter chenwenxiniae TaxID=2906456 RepID=UPI001F2D5E63|nr:helix-turn-helix domain-containing protein [Dyadobacter chenwenxiniae]MCF0049226.1 helix-turn-helix domain-containing protein [Dyadobacter chenwenxiniae]